MPVTSTYRLPGVYSKESFGTRLGNNATGNAVVAFVGTALGYLTASEQVTLNGTTGVALANANIIDGSYSVKSRANGRVYTNGTDYAVTVSGTNVSTISRHINELKEYNASVTGTATGALSYNFTVASPTFSLLDIPSTPVDGYVIKGTLTISKGGNALTEGTDYVVDYFKGVVSAKSTSTNLNENCTLAIQYSWTKFEPIQLIGESATSLEHSFISNKGLGNYTAQIVSCTYGTETFGNRPGLSGDTEYVEGVDYVVDYATGRIARTAGSRIPSYSDVTGNLMYINYGWCGIKSGETVVVTYHYNSNDYNNAHWFDTYNQFAAYFGNAWNDEGEISSPLSMAAYLATRNGMQGCYGVAVGSNTTNGANMMVSLADWEEAFEALEVVQGIDIIVPLSGDTAIWSLAQEHIVTMQAEEDERVAICGADGTADVISASTMIGYATGLNDEDMWLVSPSTFRMLNPVTSEVTVVPAYYMAAAVAGYNASVPQYMPLTAKNPSGFYSANEYNTKSTKTNECANGLMYVDEVGGNMRILHGLTTNASNIIGRESNIVLTKYYIIKQMRRLFANGYIGSIITDQTLLSIKGAAHALLTDLRDANYLTSFVGPTVEQDSINPTQVNVSFSYRPTYSLNYIEITFTIDASVD